uniref:Tc1-like transposase DDE domain-containing protein n=1 Tax=Amphiprion percula TaxID=161767 RepID=A0A3P8RRW3_AMPPE
LTMKLKVTKKREYMPHMVWPAMSPDLNPIEHVWDQLKQRLDARTPPPCDLAELHVALVEEWNALPQNNVMRLVRSMRRRCQAVIAANVFYRHLWLHTLNCVISSFIDNFNYFY